MKNCSGGLFNHKAVFIAFNLLLVLSNAIIAQNVSYNLNSIPITGEKNSAFGNNALFLNTSGTHNSAVGFDALYSNTSGRYNVAIGSSSLFSNTTGTYNTAIGHYSLYNNTGISNTAFGLINNLRC